MQWLHANGRMFAERDHIHTLLYRHEWTARGAGDGAVPAELALDHPFGGLTATLVRPADGVTADARSGDYVARALLARARARLLADPAACRTRRSASRATTASTAACSTCRFTTASPDTWWDEQRAAADALAADGVGEMLWTAPFIPTIPGTDTYTDQLW